MRERDLVVVETLKMRGLPEGSDERLLEFLRMYRDAAQLGCERAVESRHKAL